jgi:hypothetical protein
MFLAGKVVLEDGTAPQDQVAVELICQGTTIRQVYVSSGGTFSLQVSLGRGSQDQLQPIDASISSTTAMALGDAIGISPTLGAGGGQTDLGSARYDSLNLSACELMARLPGYTSDRVALGLRRVLDNPDVGTIVLRSNVTPAPGTVSVRTLSAPPQAPPGVSGGGPIPPRWARRSGALTSRRRRGRPGSVL